MTAAAAWQALLDGNQRYATDTAVNCNNNYDRRREVAGGQHPFAMVLGCADSRVPPEVVFDQRLGDLFTVRVAGNVADDIAIGSLEYAVLHFSPALLVVLGHQKCGAVDATLEAIDKGGPVPGHIGSIVSAIKPAVAGISANASDRLDKAIEANASAVAASLNTRSSVLAEAVKAGKLQIRAAYYSLTDGRVRPVE